VFLQNKTASDLFKRYLVIITLYYIAGIVIARFWIEKSDGAYWLAGLILLFTSTAYIFKVIGLYKSILLILVTTCGAVAFFYSIQHPAGSIINYAGASVYVEGTIVDEPIFYEDHAAYRLQVEVVETGEGKFSVPGTLLVKLYDQGEENFWFGEKIRIRGTIVEPRGKRNPGGFDYRFYLRSQGIDALIYPRAAQVICLGQGEVGWLVSTAVNLRSKMVNFIEKTLPSPSAELLTAVLFGQRHSLPEDVEQNFRRAGAGHLMAVSGLHVGLVAALIIGLWKSLGLRGRFPLILAIILIFAYAYLTGMRPSALRAAIMVSIALGALLADREMDLPTAVSTAALVTLFFNPLLLYTIGFQLSYAATLVVLYGYRPLQEVLSLIKCPRFLCSPLAVVLAAQIGVLPLCVYYFQHLPTGAVLFNLLLMPLIVFVVGFGLLGALFGLFFSLPGEVILWACRPLLELMLRVTGLSSMPGLYISLQPPGALFIIIFYGLVTVLLFLYYQWLKAGIDHRNPGFAQYIKMVLSEILPVKTLGRLAFTGSALFIVVVIMWWGILFPSQQNLRVTFIDVGQGASALLETPCGAVIMVDAGGQLSFFGDPGDIGKRVVLPLLRREGIKRIDLAIITHPHEDHFGGFIPLVNEITIDRMLVSPVPGGSYHYEELLEQAKYEGVAIEEVREGQIWHCGPDLLLHMYGPPKELLIGTNCDLNNNSIVFLLQYDQVRILFTGDIEDAAVSDLLRKQKDLRADILQVPHHGGYMALMPEFLEMVSPKLAVIQVGSNPFGHPHPFIIESLKEAEVEIFRNDHHGAIIIETDGTDLHIIITEQPALVNQ